MISTTSLQAFSGTAPTRGAANARGAAPSNPALLARAQPDAASRQAAPQPLPDIRPGVPPPRGSLLNRTA